MVKSYFKYRAKAKFGLTSSNGRSVFDISGKYIIATSLEDAVVMDAKHGRQVCSLFPLLLNNP